MTLEVDASTLSYSHRKKANSSYAMQGAERVLTGSVTRAAFQTAYDEGPGTIWLDNMTCLSDGTALVVKPHVAVISRTGTNVLRANTDDTERLLDFEQAHGAVWNCDLDGNAKMADNGDLAWFRLNYNRIVNCTISGGINTDVAGIHVYGGRYGGIIGCSISGLYRGIDCTDKTISSVTYGIETGAELLIEFNEFSGNFFKDIVGVTNAINWKPVRRCNIFREPAATSFNFQSATMLAQNDGYYNAPVEIGDVYVGNGLAYSNAKAAAGTYPNGVADQSSWHGARNLKRRHIICINGGEAALVTSRGCQDCTTEHFIVINLDNTIAAGSKNDDSGDPSQPDADLLNTNTAYRKGIALHTALDRDNIVSNSRYGLRGRDTDGLTVEDLFVVGEPDGNLVRAIEGIRVNNFSSARITEFNASTPPSVNVTGY